MNVAVFAPEPYDTLFRNTLAFQDKVNLLSTAELETRDEWQMRRWFAEQMPDIVIVGTLDRPERNSREIFDGVQGGINIISSALGFSRHLRVYGSLPTNSFYILRRLCSLLAAEKGVDFQADPIHSRQLAAQALVLFVRNVAQETEEASGTEGSDEGGEVRDQVVPESSGPEQHGVDAKVVLEMPRPPLSGEAPGSLHAE